ncbi:sensor histidine kinase [Paenibacillus thalictri]|uniref:histidine kinase n=1 Tax=Paenibacillus thalictri TaxID=2527873 RepID=A0A4Q9DUM6_9BACL|nr:sensor histidine kinase [Paenibacillus thalictri]TBL80714.1 sensor histidine kinase [Paenibacillus thalictri]
MKIFSSLSIKLISAFVIFVLIPIYLALLLLYQQYSSTLESKVQDYSNKSFEQMYQLVGSRLLDLVRVSNGIILNPATKQIVERGSGESDWQYQLDMDTLDRAFDEAQNTGRVSSIYFTLVARDGRVFGNWPSLPGKSLTASEWYGKAVQHSPFPVWMPLENNFLRNSSAKSPMLSMAQAIEGNSGVLRTSIEQSQIDKWLSEIKNSWATLIYNEQGELIYGHDEELPDELKLDLASHFTSWNSVDIHQFNRSGFRVISQGLPLKGWTVVQLLDEAELYKDIRFLMKSFTLFSLISLLVFIGVTALVTNRITRPLKQLRWAMKRVGEGDWDAEVAITTKDEVSHIALHFNRMVRQIGDLFGQLREEERKKSEIYYESLLAQVNPHFLFNTLSSIKWTASISKAHHVADLISSLGKILEMSTSRVEDRISLRQEIDYVQHYMKLQYARFGERVSLSIHVPDELQQAMIPKFVLQPLVENAILHGFEQHEIRGEIRIEAEAGEDKLILFVKDNGKGISEERLKQLFAETPAGNQPEHRQISGIGLRNVQERIRMLYGPQYGMMFASVEGISTVVRIVLPLVMGKEERLYVQSAYRG